MIAPGKKLRQHKLGAGAVSPRVFKIRNNMRKLEREGKRDEFFAVFSLPLAIGNCVIAKLEVKVRKYWGNMRGDREGTAFSLQSNIFLLQSQYPSDSSRCAIGKTHL